MPELPDITIYVESLERHLKGEVLLDLRLINPFVLRSVEPGMKDLIGKKIVAFRNIGKRIVFEFKSEGDQAPLFLVLHLMIAGRLRWKKKNAKVARKRGLAVFDFEKGSLVLTEASTKKRASIYIVSGEEELSLHDRGGIDIFLADTQKFIEALSRKNHTIKRALTDPRILSGIGNAYSDEILHHAKLSPYKQTKTFSEEEFKNLNASCKAVLEEWTTRFRQEVDDGFPDKVTAFRKEMAVHGKYKEPCPVCGNKIQRIRYASNESNYCAHCQTGGKLFADRCLSKLLKKDWPKTLEELDERMNQK